MHGSTLIDLFALRLLGTRLFELSSNRLSTEVFSAAPQSTTELLLNIALATFNQVLALGIASSRLLLSQRDNSLWPWNDSLDWELCFCEPGSGFLGNDMERCLGLSHLQRTRCGVSARQTPRHTEHSMASCRWKDGCGFSWRAEGNFRRPSQISGELRLPQWESRVPRAVGAP